MEREEPGKDQNLYFESFYTEAEQSAQNIYEGLMEYNSFNTQPKKVNPIIEVFDEYVKKGKVVVDHEDEQKLACQLKERTLTPQNIEPVLDLMLDGLHMRVDSQQAPRVESDTKAKDRIYATIFELDRIFFSEGKDVIINPEITQKAPQSPKD